jgi:hypothetical protein
MTAFAVCAACNFLPSNAYGIEIVYAPEGISLTSVGRAGGSITYVGATLSSGAYSWMQYDSGTWSATEFESGRDGWQPVVGTASKSDSSPQLFGGRIQADDGDTQAAWWNEDTSTANLLPPLVDGNNNFHAVLGIASTPTGPAMVGTDEGTAFFSTGSTEDPTPALDGTTVSALFGINAAGNSWVGVSELEDETTVAIYGTAESVDTFIAADVETAVGFALSPNNQYAGLILDGNAGYALMSDHVAHFLLFDGDPFFATELQALDNGLFVGTGILDDLSFGFIADLTLDDPTTNGLDVRTINELLLSLGTDIGHPITGIHDGVFNPLDGLTTLVFEGSSGYIRGNLGGATAVPEPSTMILLTGGALALAVLRRRNQAHS